MTKPFKICTYEDQNKKPRAGIVIDERIHDISNVFKDDTTSVLDLLVDWASSLRAIERYVALDAAGVTSAIPLARIRLLAPVLYPGTVFCAGANYKDHVEEMAKVSGMPLQDDLKAQGVKPWHFLKPSRSCVVGTEVTVKRPTGCQKLDWEAELAVVIGRVARHVAIQDALDHVAGYTVANDLSARDLGRRPQVDKASPFHYDWTAHKGFDGACPLGPWITPASDVADPQNLAIRLTVNGVLMQNSTTAGMIQSVAEQISHLSQLVTLHPGDLILTGTPAGVGTGRGVFLQDGDKVEASVEGLGSVVTTIAASSI